MSESSDSLFSFHRSRRARAGTRRRDGPSTDTSAEDDPRVQGGEESEIAEQQARLSEFHTLDEASHAPLAETLATLQRRRQKSEASLNVGRQKRRSKLTLSFLSRRAPVDRERESSVVREENSKLKQRLAKLEMDQVELSTLRHKVAELEWALDVVRDDAERVREDAIAVLSGIDSQRRSTML